MGLRASLVAITALEGARPLAMFGVVPEALMGGRGKVWLLAVEDAYRYGGDLISRGPAIIDHWLGTFERLENVVSVENAKAIRLLKKWDFQFEAGAHVYGGVEFVRFFRLRDAKSVRSLSFEPPSNIRQTDPIVALM